MDKELIAIKKLRLSDCIETETWETAVLLINDINMLQGGKTLLKEKVVVKREVVETENAVLYEGRVFDWAMFADLLALFVTKAEDLNIGFCMFATFSKEHRIISNWSELPAETILACYHTDEKVRLIIDGLIEEINNPESVFKEKCYLN